MKQELPIPSRTLRRVAVDAEVDARTAAKVVLGLPVRPGGKERVLDALAKNGVDISKLTNAKFGAIAAGSAATHNPRGDQR